MSGFTEASPQSFHSGVLLRRKWLLKRSNYFSFTSGIVKYCCLPRFGDGTAVIRDDDDDEADNRESVVNSPSNNLQRKFFDDVESVPCVRADLFDSRRQRGRAVAQLVRRALEEAAEQQPTRRGRGSAASARLVANFPPGALRNSICSASPAARLISQLSTPLRTGALAVPRGELSAERRAEPGRSTGVREELRVQPLR